MPDYSCDTIRIFFVASNDPEITGKQGLCNYSIFMKHINIPKFDIKNTQCDQNVKKKPS